MATMTFDPLGYGGVAPLSIIGPGEMFWWDNKGVSEPALRLDTPEPDHHWRVVHFPKGKLPKYVEHDPADQRFFLMAGRVRWRVDGIPSAPVTNGGGAAGTICVGASGGDAILCASSTQGVVRIDLKTFQVTSEALNRAPFKRWAVGVLDANAAFFSFYNR